MYLNHFQLGTKYIDEIYDLQISHAHEFGNNIWSKKELLDLLKKVDTPTVCNAIEVVEGKRGFSKFTQGTMIPSDNKNTSIVGFAKTATIRAREPSRGMVSPR